MEIDRVQPLITLKDLKPNGVFEIKAFDGVWMKITPIAAQNGTVFNAVRLDAPDAGCFFEFSEVHELDAVLKIK